MLIRRILAQTSYEDRTRVCMHNVQNEQPTNLPFNIKNNKAYSGIKRRAFGLEVHSLLGHLHQLCFCVVATDCGYLIGNIQYQINIFESIDNLIYVRRINVKQFTLLQVVAYSRMGFLGIQRAVNLLPNFITNL